MVKFLQEIIDKLGEKLFNNIIPGQGIVTTNKNFDTQVNKISSLNPKSICVEPENTKKKEK